jgi:NYN domain
LGAAKPHGTLVDNRVHVFVDDQNLFWGIVHGTYGSSFRIDFGQLLIQVAKDSQGQTRGVGSAYIAGVIPDDDSFWRIATREGFTVRRGFLGASGRSKQDDAYLIRDLTATLYEQPGPSTIVLVAGDADYVPPLELALEKGWRNEVAFITRGISTALIPQVHEFRTVEPSAIQYAPGL